MVMTVLLYSTALAGPQVPWVHHKGHAVLNLEFLCQSMICNRFRILDFAFPCVLALSRDQLQVSGQGRVTLSPTRTTKAEAE